VEDNQESWPITAYKQLMPTSEPRRRALKPADHQNLKPWYQQFAGEKLSIACLDLDMESLKC
jgi:hypothetical protein